MKNIVRLSLASLAFAAPAAGQTVFAVDNLGEFHDGPIDGDRIVTFDVSDPAVVTVLGRTGIHNTLMGGLDFANGELYAYSRIPSGGNLYRIDEADGSAALVGGGGVLTGDTVMDLSWSEVDQKMYALGSELSGSLTIYEVDLSTGAASSAHVLSAPSKLIVFGLAIEPVNNEMYVLDGFTDAIYLRVGDALQALPEKAGYRGGFSQGMTFDPTSGTLYVGAWSQAKPRAELRSADTSTGATTFLGNIGPFNGSTNRGEHSTGDIAIRKEICQISKYCNPGSGSGMNVGTIGIQECSLQGTVTVDLSNGTAGQFTYLLIGDGNAVVSQPPGASGDLCVLGGSCLGRYAQDIGQISPLGTYSTDISNSVSGGPGYGIPTCGGSIQAGETWYFQYWLRQPMGQPSTFSEALCVTFE